MTDKIYGVRGASVAMSAGYSATAEVADGAWSEKASAASGTPIEDALGRINNVINRLFNDTEALRIKLDPYLGPSNPSNVVGASVGSSSTSALGGALHDVEMRLRDLDYILTDIYERVER